MSGPADVIHWDGRKWPNRPHWQFDMRRIGDDEHGTWFSVPAGTRIQRGDDPERSLANGFVMLVPLAASWEAEFYWDHPDHSIYVNVGTQCEWSAGAVRQVDLDLDVVRTVDGRVETLDEDEFELHQVLYGYPVELIEAARRTADEVALMLEGRVEPFDRAAERWIGQVRHRG